MPAIRRAHPGSVRCAAPRQHPPYPVERVIGATAVSVGLLLDAPAPVVDGDQSQPYDMEWMDQAPARHGGRPADRLSSSRGQVQCRDLNCGGSALGSDNEPVGQYLSTAARRNVDQLAAVEVNDSGGEHRRAGGTGQQNAVSSTPNTDTAAAARGARPTGSRSRPRLPSPWPSPPRITCHRRHRMPVATHPAGIPACGPARRNTERLGPAR